MRDVINKRLSEDAIIRAAEIAGQSGITALRLYFMVGLPWEEEEDVRAIAPLVKETRRAFLAGRGRRITVSINPFVPKPQTPYQWHPMARRESLEARLGLAREELASIESVRVLAKSIRLALLQGIISRGGRPVGDAIGLREHAGITWKKAWARAQVDADSELHRERAFGELLPWDHIDVGVDRRFLWDEYMRSAAAAGTSNTRS
jgi:radical SAM superfamily enzyme YgiQ (UPF0313 family)